MRPPTGAAARKRATVYGSDASTKAAYGQKHRPLPTASLQGAACSRRGRRGNPCPRPARRGAAPTEAPPASMAPAGKGSRRLRRGSDGDDTEGVRASFVEKDNPGPMNSKKFEDCP
ncbi:hypothetical protein BHE74_00048941, partial [Ensete ventricosum]